MKPISDWLEDKLIDEGLESDTSSLEQQAEFIRAEAESDGYSTEELEEACGGDIAEFLRTRYGGAAEGATDHNRVVDPFLVPLAPMAAKQE